MPYEARALVGFNRGLMSRRGNARTDLPRTQLSADTMVNWMPRTLGPMSLRPGFGYISNTNGNAKAKHWPFVFATDDAAHIEFTEGAMRVRIDDQLITRAAVTAQTTNGNFTGNITGWTDASDPPAFVAHNANRLQLKGVGSAAAIATQEVAVTETGTQHALRIVVDRGPVILRVGSTAGGDEYVDEMTLGTGTHSIAFTPTGNFHIQFISRRDFLVYVDSCTVEAAGVMSVTAPWTLADQPFMRRDQNGNTIYVACKDKQQYKIVRSSTRSWGVEKYEPETGPFRGLNVSPITMTPSGLNGDITIAASESFFKSTNVGSLLRIASSGQTVTESAGADDTFTDPIRVSGVEAARIFAISIVGPFTGTVTLQRSIGEPGAWSNVQTYTVDTSTSFDDGLDNQVIYYRIGFDATGHTSGTADLVLTYASGSIEGVARITAYTSPTVVDARVLKDFGSLTASADWWEGKWSDRRGWPTAVTIHDTRMTMLGRNAVDLSIVDQFEDYDDGYEGDAGPINRSIGVGPVDVATWAMSLTRLVFGSLANAANLDAVKVQGNNPFSIRSSSLDEPLTPTNFNIKTSAPTGMFIDTSLTRLMELVFDVNEGDYVARDMCVVVPDLHSMGLAGIAVQYKPDLRVWCWRTDGTIGLLVRDRAENVMCWCELETAGVVEDISVMPGTVEDRVYLSVLRGSERYLEKVALESECVGGVQNKQADAFIAGTQAGSATITGLPYPNGTQVIVWADGVDLSPDDEDTLVQRTYTVTSGSITLDVEVENYVVGLGFEAPWKSGKLAFAAALGTALNTQGKLPRVGFVLQDTHARGLRYGHVFDGEEEGFLMASLPLVEDDEDVDPDSIHDEYDQETMEMEGDWDTDPRVCLLARAPRPCTVKAITVPLRKNG